MKLGNVVVGGGTGFVGSHVCKLFKSKGYSITIISRMPGPNHMSWQDLQRIGLPGGTVAVVNLAGQNVLDPLQRWNAGFKQNVWNSRINTTTALAQAIIQSGDKPSAFVTMSGVGIYKPSPDTVYTEDWRGSPFDFLSQLCHEWERAAKLPAHAGCRQITIRSGVVLGRHGGMIKQLFLPFYLGLGGPVATGDQYLPWIHVDDLARLILFAVENNNVKGLFNGVAPHQITNKEFAHAFAGALWRPALIPVPTFLLNMIFSKERAKMLTQGQNVLPKRASTLGFTYVFPNIHSACQEIVNSPAKSPF